MQTRALILDQVGASHGILKNSSADLSADEARQHLTVLAPIIWHIGHIALMDAYYARKAGESAPLPPDYNGLFATFNQRAEYPALEAVTATLEAVLESLQRAVAEANLDAPDEGPDGLWKDVGGLFVFANNHRWYHIGEIDAMRALLHKAPSVRGAPWASDW